MLIFEAKGFIESRIALKSEYGENVPVYFEALETANKALDVNQRVCELLDTFYHENEELHKNDRYSRESVIKLFEYALNGTGDIDPFEEEEN